MIRRAAACLLRDWLEQFGAKSCAFCSGSANPGEDLRRQEFNTVIWTYCGLTANPGRRTVDNNCHNRLKSLVGVRRFSSHIRVLGPSGSTRIASWLKFAPGEFVILGVLPATLRVALRSKIAPGDFVNFRPLPPENGS